MKYRPLLLCLIASLTVNFAHVHAAKVSVSFFYDALESDGDWIDSADYGYVWHPRDVDKDWRPYTVGKWAYTDAGWTWVSEEPFGWATYHYGRWANLKRTGWVWVPDTEWGPAWVSWRHSKKHVGWAPLPPEARFEARVGFRGWVDSYYDIGPTSYSFVRVRDLGAPRLRTVIVQPRDNVTIIQQTRNITNITYVNQVIVNEGPRYDVMVRESAQPIPRLKLERRTEFQRIEGQTERYDARVVGGSLQVAAPEIEVSREAVPRKVAQKIDRVEVNRGWSDVGDEKQIRQLRAKVAVEAKPPTELPEKPKLIGSDQSPTTRPPATSADGAAPNATEPGKRGTPTASPEIPANTPKDPTEPLAPGTPAEPPKAPGAEMKEPASPLPGTPTADPAGRKGKTAAVPPEAEQPAKPITDGKPRDRRPSAGVEKPEASPDGAVPSTPPAVADPSKPEQNRKMRDRGKTEAVPAEKPVRDADQPARPDATERPAKPERAKPESSDRPPQPERPRPEASERPPQTAPARPETKERPPQPERSKPEATERPPQPERTRPEAKERLPQPERPRPEAAERPPQQERARPEAKERPPQPKPAKPAATERPAQPERAQPQGNPPPKEDEKKPKKDKKD